MDADFRRFQQKVRSGVRAYVAREREAPPLSLWASEGRNPRRVGRVPVGAAHDAPGVRESIVAGVEERGSSYAALGRGVKVAAGELGVLVDTTQFALLFVSAASIECVIAEIVAGEVGAWRPSVVTAGTPGDSMADSFFFVQQAIRGAERAR